MKKSGMIVLVYFWAAAGIIAQDKKLFTTMPSSHTGITFNNQLYEDDNINFYSYGYLYNGGGVAIGDINNDGLPDIYFSSTTGFNKLYLNLGNLQFRDITDAAGVSGELGVKSGVNMVDINNDGWLDIVASRAGPFQPQFRRKLVYVNNGNLTFTDKAKEIGLDDASFTTQTYFFDHDKDGDMDALLINHPISFNNTMVLNGKMVNGKLVIIDDTARVYVSHRLYENRNGRFVDVSKKAGISTYAFGLSAGIADFNDDGWPDIYIANDFRKPDYLYINNRNGTFSEKLADYFQHISLSSMGMDINDLNNDGLQDVFVADMALEDPVRQKTLFVQNQHYDRFQLMVQFGLYYQYPHNVLQLNMGNGTFSEIAYFAGVAETDWSWAPLIADFDNDGWKDMYITNGFRRDITDWDYKEFFVDSINTRLVKGQKVTLAELYSKIPSQKTANYFYRNNGSLRFDNYSEQWSDAPPSFSNGAVYADLDNDGDLDMVVNNIHDEAFILRNNLNETNPGRFLRFRFYKSRHLKQELYGTTVKLTDEKGNLQFQCYDPQRGFMSSHEHVLHFGTGANTVMAKAEIIFPSGKMITLYNVTAGQALTLYESDAMQTMAPPEKKPPLFKETATPQKFTFRHIENDFIDFKREPLIPYKCSRKGPYYAKADVNGDGREDIYIGGAAGSEGSLMLQNAEGSFVKKPQPAFTKDKAFEDGGSVFFDADGDKDNDLYVVSGGAQFTAGSTLYQDRLYLNDGKGNFIRSVKGLPKDINNGSCVIALDFDGDGDLDLFVGGGVKPGKFPQHDNNMLLQNNKGIFTDVTLSYAPGLKNTGIVNYAAWGDVNGDGQNELVLAGEWMPVMIFKTDAEKLMSFNAPVTMSRSGSATVTNLNAITGWWNVVLLNDIDNDGDLDILAGNRGTNSRIGASPERPCTVYAKDFDGNGSYDAVLGYYIGDKCYPMYHRDQLIDQMPFMRKKFYRYHLYAGKTMDEIFTPEQITGMDVYRATCFESGVFLNEGNGSFQFLAFPEMAQLSNINDMLVADWDKDGKTDILVAGNSSDADVSTGNYDAMAALLLLGDGKGNFNPLTATGISPKGEVRRIIPLQRGDFILLQNNGPAKRMRYSGD
ncbi:MAG: RNA-binding protein [Bacteroidetes bacterium]|nr:RNA-binding protein [Bacteroidota bacterium]